MAAPHILFLTSLTAAFGRGVLRGIRTYIRRHMPWTVDPYEGPILPPDPPLDHTDGIIAQASLPACGKRLCELGWPTINVSNAMLDIDLPRIASDDHAVGRMGAEHLVQAGLRNLAFCGFAWLPNLRHGYAKLRAEGFMARAREAGIAARWFEADCPVPSSSSLEAIVAQLGAWLLSLPRPVGIMGSNDVRGYHLIVAARQVGLRVPEDVAVLGVDNDELECERAPLPLSSIALDFPRIGYEAAAALARLMGGEAVEDVRIPPLHVVVRQSSDMLAINDPAVATAVRFIREHAGRQIQVEHVAEAAMLSRRTLERRFRAALGIAPHEEIRRCHIERARQLLAETSLGMGEVAAASGFRDAKTLSMLFRHATGVAPTDYRKQHRSQVT